MKLLSRLGNPLFLLGLPGMLVASVAAAQVFPGLPLPPHGPRIPPPVRPHVWVAPVLFFSAGIGPFGVNEAIHGVPYGFGTPSVTLTNLGRLAAHVLCRWAEADPDEPWTDEEWVTVPPGGRAACRAELDDGWLAIISDAPIQPYAREFRRVGFGPGSEGGGFSGGWSAVSFVQVDCGSPFGFELPCDAARDFVEALGGGGSDGTTEPPPGG